MYTETLYIEPGDNTGGLWMLNKPYRERMYGRSGSMLVKETLTYYDEGAQPYMGMASGTLTRGDVTRVTDKLDVGSDAVITSVRNLYDAHGNVVETMDPNGTPGVHAHRTQYTYDADQLRIVQTEVLLEDSEGNPYKLRKAYSYEPLFDKIEESTDWIRVVGDEEASGRRFTSFLYDEFARLLYRILPGGDNSSSPTEEYAYDLGNPASRNIIRSRSQVGGPLDQERVVCMDGRGRTFQTRTKIGDNLYQVDGFTVFNVQSNPVRIYQPYTSTGDRCDQQEPGGVSYTEFRYDATARELERTSPDASIYSGTASVSRMVYTPLTVMEYDKNDTDDSSPFADTPTIKRQDGLGRLVSIERLLGVNQSETIELHYDSLGRMTGYTDPAGNRKEQVYDLLDRVLSISDPNSANLTTYQYDDVGNIIRSVDDRNIVTISEYDGRNRLVKRWDEAKVDESTIEWTYDYDSDCGLACPNSEGKLVGLTYPGVGSMPDGERFGYDLRGRRVLQNHTLAGYTFAFENTYDNVDRLTGVTYPNGTIINRRYDVGGRLLGIDRVVDGVTFELVDGITYDERNQMNGMACGDGSSKTMNYDAIMRPSETVTFGPNSTVLQGFGYTYDRNGNITAIEDQSESEQDKPSFGQSFGYDAWYRTTSSSFGGGETVNFGFDALDNLTSITSSTGSDVQVGNLNYDSERPNALVGADGLSYGYDAAGYMTSRDNQTYQWDFMGRMISASEGATEVARFVYGPNQSRVAKIEGDRVVLYPNRNFEVRDGIGTIYVMMRGKRIIRIEDDSLATELLTDADANGEVNAADAWLSRGGDSPVAGGLLWSSVRRLLVEQGPADKTTYLHHDHLRSITLATALQNGSTVVEGERSFYPLGI
ncbi:MAG: hypothetical protein AAFS10_13880, partial [Myxococcota bacterium]